MRLAVYLQFPRGMRTHMAGNGQDVSLRRLWRHDRNSLVTIVSVVRYFSEKQYVVL